MDKANFAGTPFRDPPTVNTRVDTGTTGEAPPSAEEQAARTKAAAASLTPVRQEGSPSREHQVFSASDHAGELEELGVRLSDEEYDACQAAAVKGQRNVARELVETLARWGQDSRAFRATLMAFVDARPKERVTKQEAPTELDARDKLYSEGLERLRRDEKEKDEPWLAEVRKIERSLKKFIDLTALQNMLAARMQDVHDLTPADVFHVLWTIFKDLLPREFRDGVQYARMLALPTWPERFKEHNRLVLYIWNLQNLDHSCPNHFCEDYVARNEAGLIPFPLCPPLKMFMGYTELLLRECKDAATVATAQKAVKVEGGAPIDPPECPTMYKSCKPVAFVIAGGAYWLDVVDTHGNRIGGVDVQEMADACQSMNAVQRDQSAGLHAQNERLNTLEATKKAQRAAENKANKTEKEKKNLQSQVQREVSKAMAKYTKGGDDESEPEDKTPDTPRGGRKNRKPGFR